MDHNTELDWRSIWKFQAEPKCRFFIWLLLQRKLPTADRINKRGARQTQFANYANQAGITLTYDCQLFIRETDLARNERLVWKTGAATEPKCNKGQWLGGLSWTQEEATHKTSEQQSSSTQLEICGKKDAKECLRTERELQNSCLRQSEKTFRQFSRHGRSKPQMWIFFLLSLFFLRSFCSATYLACFFCYSFFLFTVKLSVHIDTPI